MNRKTRALSGSDSTSITRSEPSNSLGDRIKAAADVIGSRKEAARLAGVSDDMLYRYMRGETPPRFEAIVSLARAAGFSLDWMATGQEGTLAARETAGGYDGETERWARERIAEIEARVEREAKRPIPAERLRAEAELDTALADLRRIARLVEVSQDVRIAAARLGDAAFGDRTLAQVRALQEQDGQHSAQRLADVADELDGAIREVGYRPPDLILDGLKTAMYVNDMSRAAAVTLLQFLDAQERKQRS